MTDRDFLAELGNPARRVSWLIGVIQDRVAHGNAPKTLAYLMLAYEAAREELDPPPDEG
jgi:hypothetical protein